MKRGNNRLEERREVRYGLLPKGGGVDALVRKGRLGRGRKGGGEKKRETKLINFGTPGSGVLRQTYLFRDKRIYFVLLSFAVV